LAAKILEKVPTAKIDQIHGGGGDFIVIADGQKLWDKNGTDDGFPDGDALAGKIAALA